MNTFEEKGKVQHILREIDRLIVEMSQIRSEVAALSEQSPSAPKRSIRDAGYFGMWTDREDMQGQSSREWLEHLRKQQ